MTDKALEIDLLAVGDGTKGGDAILIRYGDLVAGGGKQTVILIDGGYKKTAPKIKEMLAKYYNCKNRAGKYVIDLMILSHPDLDHVGGLVELSKDPEIEIQQLLMQKPWEVVDINDFEDGRITPNSLENRLKNAFKQASELFEAIPESRHIEPTPRPIPLNGATLHILGPHDDFYRKMLLACPKTPDAKLMDEKRQKIFCQKIEEEEFTEDQEIEWNYDEATSEINETSLIILFEYDGHKILLTGDAGKMGLENAIQTAEANYVSLSDIDIIKMPHHGSRKNVDPDILNKLRGYGTRCYISCAQGDEGHHPSKRLVNLLNQMEYRVLATSGNNLHKGYGAPLREDYRSANPLGYYPTMEKL